MHAHTHTREEGNANSERTASNAWSNDEQTLSLRIELLADVIFALEAFKVAGGRRPLQGQKCIRRNARVTFWFQDIYNMS